MRRAGGGATGSSSSPQESKSARVFPLNFYQSPPNERKDLVSFERLAEDRLLVMRKLEEAEHRRLLKDQALYAELHDYLESWARERNEPHHMSCLTREDKEDDVLSHWSLSLGFCQTEEHRARFARFERLVFEARFTKLVKEDPRSVRLFLEDNELNLDYEEVTESTKQALIQECGLPPRSPWLHHAHDKLYRMKFQNVPRLVATRKCLVHRGMAYVFWRDFITFLSEIFVGMLMKRLKDASKQLPMLKDERLELLTKLPTQYAGSKFTGKQDYGDLVLGEIPLAAQTSFPMCGRRLVKALTADHHLKHEARLQLTGFLKGAGLTMQDCLAYFRSEFVKRPMTPSEFDKNYAYNIRHSYGKEGKRKDYRPMNCEQVISKTNKSSEATHGCPFKSFDTRQLQKALVEWGGGGNDLVVKEMVEKAKEGHFQIACRLHWELLHPNGDSGEVGNHPNTFFLESRRWHKQKMALEAPAPSASTTS